MPIGKRRDYNQPATFLQSKRIETCPWADNSEFNGPCDLTPKNICPAGPSRPQCTCSGVLYLLAAACESCLNSSSHLSWDEYNKEFSCHDLPQAFPDPLPTGTNAIPTWALVMNSQTPTPTTFDLTKAQSLAKGAVSGSPSSTVSSVPPASVTSGTSTDPAAPTSSNQSGVTSSATSTPPSSETPITAVSKSTSQAGPIAGGIIGGAILLALIGVAIWYTRVRRRRKHIAPSAAYKAAVRAGNTSPMPYQPVHHESPRNSTDELRPEHPGSWRPSAPASIRSESRFLEHT